MINDDDNIDDIDNNIDYIDDNIDDNSDDIDNNNYVHQYMYVTNLSESCTELVGTQLLSNAASSTSNILRSTSSSKLNSSSSSVSISW